MPRRMAEVLIQLHPPQHIQHLPAPPRRPPHLRDLLGILHLPHPRHQLSHRHKNCPPSSRTRGAGPDRLPHSLQSRHRSIRRIKSTPPHTRPRHPFASRHYRRLRRNHHPGSHRLSLGLPRIPPIGKQHRAPTHQNQRHI